MISTFFRAVWPRSGLADSRGHQCLQAASGRSAHGKVYLIGAGPGDAELLTLKAWRMIQQSDLVLFDDLVSEEMLAMLPAHIEKRYVGKRCGQHSLSQQRICQLLVEEAQSGRTIARLKGGDPAVFARSAEECDALEQAGIDFAIVPGITAASGLSAWCGIPLTHRECAQSVRFITARMQSAESEPDWTSLVGNQTETLVFYMGLNRLELICQRLVQHGMDPEMPVAVVEKVSLADQQMILGDLTDIATRVREQSLNGPALILVGEVIRHRYPVSPALLNTIRA